MISVLLARLIGLLIIALASSCATSDGGPVGTGISASAITGNVVAIEEALSPPQGSGARIDRVIHVSIDEAPGIEATTDDEGTFELIGEFAGPITLRFRAARIDATRKLDVPAGSTVVLEDIEIRREQVEAAAVRQLDFFGQTTFVNCEDGILLVDDRRPQPNQFLVHLLPETIVVDREGRELPCAALQSRSSVKIEGIVRLRTDRTIEALSIIVAPPPPPPNPPVIRAVRFVGTASQIDCGRGLLELASANETSRIRLVRSTQYFHEPQPGRQVPATCSELVQGDHVQGSGLLRLDAPGTIEAQIIVFRQPRPPNRGS
jgi:hypothetical protein